jgi:hypothetical protein
MTAQNFGEPIQYANMNIDNPKGAEIDKLNTFMFSEDKGESDIQIGRWQNICGTAYRFVFNDANANIEMDECPFGIDVLSPLNTFVVYSSKIGKRPLMGVYRTYDDNRVCSTTSGRSACRRRSSPSRGR